MSSSLLSKCCCCCRGRSRSPRRPSRDENGAFNPVPESVNPSLQSMNKSSSSDNPASSTPSTRASHQGDGPVPILRNSVTAAAQRKQSREPDSRLSVGSVESSVRFNEVSINQTAAAMKHAKVSSSADLDVTSMKSLEKNCEEALAFKQIHKHADEVLADTIKQKEVVGIAKTAKKQSELAIASSIGRLRHGSSGQQGSLPGTRRGSEFLNIPDTSHPGRTQQSDSAPMAFQTSQRPRLSHQRYSHPEVPTYNKNDQTVKGSSSNIEVG